MAGALAVFACWSCGDGSGGTGGGQAGGEAGDPAGGQAGAGGPPPALRDAAAATGRLVGTAIAYSRLAEADYANTAATAFNYVTPENAMKWSATESTRGVFDFTAADAIVDFALAHGMKVKGHTLVWHTQLPAWVSSITSADDLRTAMNDHITQVMTHFKGKVAAWDVVNEAWIDGTTMQPSPFLDLLGPGYIDEAFITARAADPDARLYYNDWGTEGTSDKANAAYDMFVGMRGRGVPLDGVGLQMHTGPDDDGPTLAALVQNMNRLAALGLEIVISEMDVWVCDRTLEQQRTRYHDVVAACLAQPACKAITLWGVTDKYSWLNRRTDLCTTGALPLLFDSNYAPKPAYDGFLNALLGQ
jgi:endo-1,4-beta-xylanase